MLLENDRSNQRTVQRVNIQQISCLLCPVPDNVYSPYITIISYNGIICSNE